LKLGESIPRKFFDQHVRPNYEEWLHDPLNERRAKNAVGDANSMAARVVHYWRDRDPSQIYGAQSEGRYRDELAARECADFALVHDVAEAYKHVELSRPSRLVTHYDQTAAEVSRWDEARWDEAPWDGQLVVTLDDGTRRPLADIMRNVIVMWERLLDRMML
jgi:hypothetical protein